MEILLSYFHIYCERCLNFQNDIGHTSKKASIEETLILSKAASNLFPSFLEHVDSISWGDC